MPRLPPQLSGNGGKQSASPEEHLKQTANINEIDGLGTGEWTTLYEYQSDKQGSRCIYSALLAEDAIAKSLQRPAWELMIGQGGPGFSTSHKDGKDITTYHRFGYENVEPILLAREFHGVKPDQYELSEEFRLFHNLYHDRHNDQYIHMDDRGRETVACTVIPGQVRVLTKLIRQYIAARQLILALYFDHRAHSDLDLSEFSEDEKKHQVRGNDRCYDFGMATMGRRPGDTFSRLLGKKLIFPGTVETSGVWPYEKTEEKSEDFIIGVADDGTPKLHSCDHTALADYFGGNEDAPHYLTPVWFKRDVLKKYYDNPQKFKVEDGYLRCAGLWGLQMDNDMPDHVMVYLGDLGRDLDYEEQRHWRNFNITPDERKQSATSFKRGFLAQFTDPSEPDLVFKRAYTDLNETWERKYGWPLFRPPHEADAHLMNQMRIPLNESPEEFESQVLTLTKLLIDSLNEGKITDVIGVLKDEKGIAKFERFLNSQRYPHTERDVKILRTLQSLRSTGAAHAKGSSFDKVAESLGLNKNSPREVFRGLLVQANDILTSLREYLGTE